MSFDRSSNAFNSCRFGRGPVRGGGEVTAPQPSLSDDLKLFAATFAAGFLFVSILIA